MSGGLRLSLGSRPGALEVSSSPPPENWQQSRNRICLSPVIQSACYQTVVASPIAYQMTDLPSFSPGPLSLQAAEGALPHLGPEGTTLGGTEGPERVQRGVTRAPGRRRLVIFFLDESPSLQQPRASSRPAANLSAVGLSQHAVWKVKVFNVNFVLPSFSSGIHRCRVSRRFLSSVSGAEI